MNYVTPSGFRDVLTDEAVLREQAAQAVQANMAAKGYLPVETPTLEVMNVLQAGGRLPGAPFKLFDARGDLLAMRPDLEIISLRGNVDTRLKRLREGRFDAILLASAGLVRLGLSATHMTPLDPEKFVPAVGQGALGIECRRDDERVLGLVKRLEDYETRVCVEAERGFLSGLDGGCQVPIGAHARLDGDTVSLDGLVAEVDGSRIFRDQLSGPADRAREVGLTLADTLKKAGAGKILERLYGSGAAAPGK